MIPPLLIAFLLLDVFKPVAVGLKLSTDIVPEPSTTLILIALFGLCFASHIYSSISQFVCRKIEAYG